MSAARAWVWGDRRFWIDETLNDMLALSEGHVAAVGHTHIYVWRRSDGAEVRRFKKFMRPAQAWFAGDVLCLKDAGRVTVCELASGAMHERAPEAGDPALPEVTRDRMGYTRTVRWADGRELEFSYPNELIGRVSVAYRGDRFAVGHGLRWTDIRDARTGAVIRTLAGASDGVLSPDGRELAVGGLGDRRIFVGAVDAWARPEGEAANGDVEALQLAPDERRLLVVAGMHGWILRAEDGAELVRLAERVDGRARWTADGAAIVGPGSEAVARWDARTGAVVGKIDLGRRTQAAQCSFDADGERVAVVTEHFPGGLMLVPGEEAVVYAIAGAVLMRVPLVETYDEGVILAPDGTRLALVTEEVLRIATIGGAVTTTARAGWRGFVTDGVRLEGAEDARRLVRVADGARVGEVEVGVVCALATSAAGWSATAGPDGRIVVRDAGLVVGWEIEVGEIAEALAVSGDGSMVFAGGWDGTVHAFRRPEAGG